MTLYTERKTGSPLQREYRYPALWMVETKVSRRKMTPHIIIETKEKTSCRNRTPKLSQRPRQKQVVGKGPPNEMRPRRKQVAGEGPPNYHT